MKAFKIIVKKGEAEKVKESTNSPLEWFPELDRLFENFQIKKIEIELETDEPWKTIFRIL